jgi:cobyrinic acid a,c-diamide synthase
MAGLLPVDTSFATRRRTLGYRRLAHDGGLFPPSLAGHEFHYATVAAEGPPLFLAADTEGKPLGPMGTVAGPVAGSFAHVIDHRAD